MKASRISPARQLIDLYMTYISIYVGCWNVRTLYQAGKLAQTIEEMHNYGICLLGIQETRWTGTGKRLLATGDTIIWSGRQDDIYLQGVPLIMDKEASRALLEWNPINERLLYIRLNSRFVKLSTVVS